MNWSTIDVLTNNIQTKQNWSFIRSQNLAYLKWRKSNLLKVTNVFHQKNCSNVEYNGRNWCSYWCVRQKIEQELKRSSILKFWQGFECISNNFHWNSCGLICWKQALEVQTPSQAGFWGPSFSGSPTHNTFMYIISVLVQYSNFSISDIHI